MAGASKGMLLADSKAEVAQVLTGETELAARAVTRMLGNSACVSIGNLVGLSGPSTKSR